MYVYIYVYIYIHIHTHDIRRRKEQLAAVSAELTSAMREAKSTITIKLLSILLSSYYYVLLTSINYYN